MSRAMLVGQMGGAPPAVGSRRHWAWLLALAAPLVLAGPWMVLLGRVPLLGGLATPAGLVLLLLVGVCTCTDLRRGKIPNWATYSAFLWAMLINGQATFLGSHVPVGEAVEGAPGWVGAVGLGQCVAGGMVCFAVMFCIYRLAGGGAGDVKLGAAIGALLGPERGLNALVLCYLIAATVIVCWVVWTLGPLTLLCSLTRKAGTLLFPVWVMPPTEDQTRLLKRPVPLAVFFGLGTVAVVAGVMVPW